MQSLPSSGRTRGAWKGTNNPQTTCELIDCTRFFPQFFRYFPVRHLFVILLSSFVHVSGTYSLFKMPLQLFFQIIPCAPNAFLLQLPFPALPRHFLFRKILCLPPSEVFASVQKQVMFFLLVWTALGMGP